MGGVAVEQLLYLMDEASEGNDEECLLANLRSVAEEEWTWVPPGSRRSVRQIVDHIGACKYMYDNHAFGDTKMTWDDPAVGLNVSMEDLQSATRLAGGEPPVRRVIEWLREGHRRLREHVAALDDAELSKARRTNWGEMKETRWIIANMIRHDLYHAGEINHIRALRQGNDLGVGVVVSPARRRL